MPLYYQSRGEHDLGSNSCQNGLLVQTNIHRQFGSFCFSINQDGCFPSQCLQNHMEGYLLLYVELRAMVTDDMSSLGSIFRQLGVLVNLRGEEPAS
ncbi:hypothetical protein POJ06DRAFT_76702 [Lipomyces tetrasporus]|uniref:HNH nuclease domain-containing protein n=1 Tax=Lipomyces tetrasporus TaxID=54092 RepID=A0AAD7QYD1_9ASCO|nr:uncharacterized protein POJ06DRAFT_76702 [Lipomyces tetrasporus]KAJ8102092.1 hypothetical protein POJ06DRAFT_76702 [Lipomyces tetrasporus]